MGYNFKSKFTKVLFNSSILIGLCFLFSSPLSAQSFRGIIKNVKGEIVNDCYILLLNAETKEIIEYTIPDSKGTYYIENKKKDIKKITIKCQGLPYVTQFKNIDIHKGLHLYTTNFNLILKDHQLDEVIVISKRIAIKVKNDTVVYDVSKFKRLEDRKVINVLKNMPGIQVDDKTGLIRYKGKPIETILLDGDDLFGKGYSIGARNISTEMVDKIEAIEDYHDNKLKKGIKKSDKVVLNLKFKENQFKLSGEASLGLGKNHYLGNINTINLSSRLKGFGVFNFNNISINETSFKDETYAIENKEELENSSVDFFKESSLTQKTNFPRSYINNIKFGTLSNLFKLSDKISFKNSISAFNDTSKNSFISKNSFDINNSTIETSNQTSNISTPEFVSLSNEMNYDISKTSLLKYQNKFVSYYNGFNQSNLQNNTDLFETYINQTKFYYQQKINYSRKISRKELLELNLFHSNDDRRQELFLLNQGSILVNGVPINRENTESKRRLLKGKMSYLKKIKRWDLELAATHIFDDEDFNFLLNPDTYNYQSRSNTSHLMLETNYNKRKKIQLKGKIILGYSDRALKNRFENTINNKKGFFINSKLKTRFKLGKKNSFGITFENNNKLNNNYYLFSNPFLIDTRTITSSRPSLDFEKSWNLSMNFSRYNLLKQSSFSFLSSYEEVSNFFIAEQTINEDINIITYFQTPQAKRDLNISASTSFFIDSINNKMSVNASAIYSNYFNVLNNNVIRSVNSSINNFNIELNSAFEGFFNYKSSIGLTYIENKQENTRVFINSNINARLETIFKLAKKTYCKVEQELLLPRGSRINTNQLFIDFSFNHIGKNIEYFILAKNLLNKSSFNQIYTSEFSTSIFSNDLFNRYIIFGLNYSF
ncbi:TonB-dependent receptor [Tenacibaculum jejuense]|uniref:Outer membrane protein beta-barrel domain-containing protein n=1 Tax=Tenacibaculum jejuense TaxID=584609 RepID=A0A238U591_9FLAO|nr:hypothetical protein [Tenacibaculum jejuense]SNR14373.1 Probable transmembrane protein of unknown function [Tenacibaculum jejuense]